MMNALDSSSDIGNTQCTMCFNVRPTLEVVTSSAQRVHLLHGPRQAGVAAAEVGDAPPRRLAAEPVDGHVHRLPRPPGGLLPETLVVLLVQVRVLLRNATASKLRISWQARDPWEVMSLEFCERPLHRARALMRHSVWTDHAQRQTAEKPSV